MPYRKSQLPELDHFDLMLLRGECDQSLVASANNIFDAANPGQKRYDRTESQYVKAARFGQGILIGTIESPDPVITFDAQVVIGNLLHADRFRGGSPANRLIMGFGDPAEVSDMPGALGVSVPVVTRRRDHAVKSLGGKLWSGNYADKFDPPEIHAIRREIGPVLYDETGPDLGYNLLAIVHRSTPAAVFAADKLRDKLPEEVVEGAERRGIKAFNAQVATGREAIETQLAVDPPVFPINPVRLQETASQWSAAIASSTGTIDQASKLFYAADRTYPTWLETARQVVEKPAAPTSPNLQAAFNLWDAHVEVDKFAPDRHSLIQYDVITSGQEATATMKDAYQLRNRKLPNTLVYAEAIQRGLSHSQAIAEMDLNRQQAHNITYNARVMVENVTARLLDLEDTPERVEILANRLGLYASKPQVPKGPRGRPRKEASTAVIQKLKPSPVPEIPLELVSVDDISLISLGTANNLIKIANTQKKRLVDMLNEALERNQKGLPITENQRKALQDIGRLPKSK